jgi:uncharacterized protein (DUF1499 family)
MIVRESRANTQNLMHEKERKVTEVVAYFSLALAILCVLAAGLSGFGHKWGWWHFRVGFSILRWAAYGALAAAGLGAIIGLFAWWRASVIAVVVATLTVIVSASTVAVPWSYLQLARAVPPIHDITTDTVEPPEFVAILPLRAKSPNSGIYGGAEIARQQHQAYPDLKSSKFSLPPSELLERATQVARSMGWQIVAAVPLEGRLEATDTTFWFGFKDDIVVRITPSQGGSRVDVRSVSRVGRSDVGANARRIRAFLAKLSARVNGG